MSSIVTEGMIAARRLLTTCGSGGRMLGPSTRHGGSHSASHLLLLSALKDKRPSESRTAEHGAHAQKVSLMSSYPVLQRERNKIGCSCQSPALMRRMRPKMDGSMDPIASRYPGEATRGCTQVFVGMRVPRAKRYTTTSAGNSLEGVKRELLFCFRRTESHRPMLVSTCFFRP